MSRYDYEASKAPALVGVPFHGLIMAAMRRADTANGSALRAAFPDVWDELEARYHARGGYLADEWAAEVAQAVAR